MATEILLNDGGAPARILPFTAGSSISAGDPVVMTVGDEQCDTVAASDVRVLGYALTAATSGSIVNVISGHGVQLNALVSGTAAAAGNMLAADSNGYLVSTSTAGNAVAICLEDGTATTSLKKVLTL